MYTTIKAYCFDQTLQVSSVPKLASGGKNVNRLEVTFNEYWDGYGKTAIFYRKKEQVYHVVMTNDSCVIPHEVTAEPGTLFVGILGSNSGGSTRTSSVVALSVAQGAITGLDPFTPLPDVYQQVLAAYAKTEAAVAAETASRKQEVAVERARLNNLVAGGTVDGSELADVRVGADGNMYASAGGAVRAQAAMTKADIVGLANGVETLRLYGNFVDGTLNSGVLNTNYKYRVSTDTIITFDRDVTLHIADGFRLAIHEFSSGAFYADWGWRTATVDVNAGVGFKCMIARATDDTGEVADPLEFTGAVTLDAAHVQTQTAINQSLYAIDNVKARYTFEPGDMKSDTGKNFNGNNHRLRTHGICYTEDDIVILGNGLYRVYLYTFDDADYTNVVTHGWVVIGANDYIIPGGSYFRLLVARIDDSTVAYDEIEDVKTSSLYADLEMCTRARYDRKKHTVKTLAQKSSIVSVAHQGFSTSDQYFGNCRLSAYKGAYLNGFDCGELDIQFTADNVPVCCHDATFVNTDGSNTVVTIPSSTLAELKACGYYGEYIATFEEVVAECKRLGLGLYIDKVENINTDDRWGIVFAILKKYAMADAVTWLAYNSKITSWNSKARFAIVADSMTDEVITNATDLASAGHEVFINVNHANCSVDQIIAYNQQLPANVNIGVWTVDDLATYEQYKPYVCAITSNKISDTMTDKS